MIFWILFPHLSVMNSASVSGHFKSQHKIHEVFSFLVCAVLNLLYNNQKRINMISFCETYACLGWHYARINFWIALIIVKLSLLKTCDWLQILLFCCFLFCCQKIILFYLLFFYRIIFPIRWTSKCLGIVSWRIHIEPSCHSRGQTYLKPGTVSVSELQILK